jgi:hypothetical protein
LVVTVVPVSPVVELFETILSLVYAPALVALFFLCVFYSANNLNVSKVSNTQSGQILLELLVGTVILALSIAFAVSLLT